MPLFTKESKLCDALFCDSSLIPVISRFGITLGVGDKSIGEICDSHGIPVDFFLMVINTFLNEDYFPVRSQLSPSTDVLLQFLLRTNDYYSKEQLPNVERHFRYLLSRKQGENNIEALYNFFLEVKRDLEVCGVNDRDRWFPMIEERRTDNIYSSGSEANYEGDYIHPLPGGLDLAFVDRLNVEDKVSDLISLFIKHLKGEYDSTLCLAVLNAVFMLRKDISQNNRLRQRLLLPIVYNLFL